MELRINVKYKTMPYNKLLNIAINQELDNYKGRYQKFAEKQPEKERKKKLLSKKLFKYWDLDISKKSGQEQEL